MLVNNSINPKCVIVGSSNLMKQQNMQLLAKAYQSLLDNEFKSKVQYISLSGDTKNNKYLKKDFINDLKEIKEFCELYNINTIGVTNAKFFQFATKNKNFMLQIERGEILNGVGELQGFTIVPLLNYFSLLNQPNLQYLLNKGTKTLNNVLSGNYKKQINKLDIINTNILTDINSIKNTLNELKTYQKLTMDIETTGLHLGNDDIISISFATSPTTGYCIPIHSKFWVEDLNNIDYSNKVKELLKDFFTNITLEQIWHNAMFDIPFIIKRIMNVDSSEYIKIDNILNKWNITDTMILKYLCVNSLSRVSLGLKDELMKIYGEYDSNINQSNLLAYSLEDVGKYNIYDTTGTFETYNKYYKKLFEEEQDDIYFNYYKPSLITLLKMKYKGFVVDTSKLEDKDKELIDLVNKNLTILYNNKYVKEVTEDLQWEALMKYNSTRVKQKSIDDFKHIKFNPNSVRHKKMLLIDTMGYDILDTTPKGNPQLGKDIIKSYLNSETDNEKIEVLKAIQDIANASKVSGTFFKAFRELSVKAKDGTNRLHTNFKLTGTVSGRLSSSDPNLQNLPSGSVFGKLVKSVCVPPKGYIFTASDYNALEDFVISEYTNDDVKTKVLIDGYDSHSLYLASYIPEKLKSLGLPYGDISKEESFIIKNHPEGKKLRNSHKPVTFALAYGGTEHTVAKSLNISLEEAKKLVDNYAKLHHKIKSYQSNATNKAKKDGYYITPFGLKIRASELHSPKQDKVESAHRSGTNALSQGTAGMITIKAINKIQKRIEDMNYSNDIIVILTIHDAIYAYVRDDLNILKWYNDNLIDCMTESYKENQKLKLKANLDIGYNWANMEELPNNCPIETIKETLIKLNTNK